MWLRGRYPAGRLVARRSVRASAPLRSAELVQKCQAIIFLFGGLASQWSNLQHEAGELLWQGLWLPDLRHLGYLGAYFPPVADTRRGAR